MSKKEILKELHSLGFTGFEHLRKEMRDGKKRYTWTRGIEGFAEWFTVILVEEEGAIYIEKLDDPLGKIFKREDVTELIDYMHDTIVKILGNHEM